MILATQYFNVSSLRSRAILGATCQMFVDAQWGKKYDINRGKNKMMINTLTCVIVLIVMQGPSKITT